MTEYLGKDNLESMREAKNYNRFLLRMVVDNAPSCAQRIIDFGAGIGDFATGVSLEMGVKPLCVEVDPLLSHRLRIEKGFTVFSDMRSLEDESVEYIYSLNVLEHIKDDQEVIRLWSRKMKKGGRLFVYVPAFQALFSSMDEKVGHYRRYRLHGLRKKISSAGFHILKGGYVDSLGFFASIVYKLLPHTKGTLTPDSIRKYDRMIFPLSLAADKVFYPFFGKNVYVLAEKI